MALTQGDAVLGFQEVLCVCSCPVSAGAGGSGAGIQGHRDPLGPASCTQRLARGHSRLLKRHSSQASAYVIPQSCERRAAGKCAVCIVNKSDLLRLHFQDEGARSLLVKPRNWPFQSHPSASVSTLCPDSLHLHEVEGGSPLLSTNWLQEICFPESLTLRNAASCLVFALELFALFLLCQVILLIRKEWYWEGYVAFPFFSLFQLDLLAYFCKQRARGLGCRSREYVCAVTSPPPEPPFSRLSSVVGSGSELLSRLSKRAMQD